MAQILVAFVLQAVLAAPASAAPGDASGELVIDLEAHISAPTSPSVNVFMPQSIVVRVKGKEDDAATFVTLQGTGEPALADYTSMRDVIVNFTRDGNHQIAIEKFSEGVFEVKAPDGRQARRMLGVRVRICAKGAALAACVPGQAAYVEEQQYAVQLESKPFFIAYSFGVAVLADFAAEQHSLEPTAQGDGLRVVQAGGCGLKKWRWRNIADCDLGYQMAAFVHYIPARYDWALWSLGVSADLPVTNLRFMFGPSVRARTLPALNDAYLTAGIAFMPIKRLLPGAGTTTYPSGTSIDSVHDSHRYGFGGFIAITFGFLRGEESFRGVFSKP